MLTAAAVLLVSHRDGGVIERLQCRLTLTTRSHRRKPSYGPVKPARALPCKTLYEVPGFDCLREVTKQFGIELTIHGGFVRRLVTAFRESGDELEHPEELAFFSSDIDVIGCEIREHVNQKP